MTMQSNALGYDEQVFVWGGWSVLKGLVPYRDFMEWKPPIVFFSHALALKLFGFAGMHFRYFFLLLALTSVVALVASLIQRGADKAVCAAFGLGIVQLFLYPGYHEASLADTESIGLSYYYLGVAALIANTRFRKIAEALGGIFLSCCVLSKEPFAPCVVATWAACYFAVNERFSRRSAFAYLKSTTLGVGIVVGALAVYMVPTGSMSAYLSLVGRYATMFRDPQKGYCVLLGGFRATGHTWSDFNTQFQVVRAQFLNPATLGMFAPFFAASLVLVPRRSWALFAVAGVAFAAGLYGVTTTKCFFMHYYVMGQSGVTFFLALGADALGRQLTRFSPGARMWAQTAVLLMLAVQVWPRVDAVTVVAKDGPAFVEPAAGLVDFIRANSTPEDKIFTTGPPGLYVHVERLAAIRGCTIIDELIPAMPGETDEEKLRPLYNELVKGQPKIVFLDPEHGPRKLRHMAAAITPFLNTFNYKKVNETLYLRSDGSP
ncbi:MAG TPA: hypothetical protein VK550_11705 [Polyangiaceae bacterium]|nr:hypothetical protein [Polyangiaceae bacterium]